MRITTRLLLAFVLFSVGLFDPVVSAQGGPQVPGAVTPVATTGPVVGPTITLVWAAVPAIERYELWIEDAAGLTRQQTVLPEEAQCAATGVCSIAFTTAGMKPGAGKWQIQAVNGAGAGPWSATQSFTLGTVSAAGTVQLGSGATSSATAVA